MRKVLQINPDATAKWLDLDAEGTTALDVLQRGVAAPGDEKGYIEPIRLSPTVEMYVHEEYLYAGCEYNVYATTLVAQAYAPRQTVDILGSVVMTGGVDREGETTALPEALGQHWIEAWDLKLDTPENVG